MDSALRWHFLHCLGFELDHPDLGLIRWGAEARRWRDHG